MTKPNRHIVLIGFMGSGKSTVGRTLSKKIGLPFFDMDEEIVAAQGMSINEIFEKHGEAHFRRVERDILGRLLDTTKQSIIATGGGAPCHHNNMELIQAKSKSFYLKLGARRLVDRLRNSTDRPLISNMEDDKLLDYLTATLAVRSKYYEQADKTIMAFKNPAEIVNRITKLINKKI